MLPTSCFFGTWFIKNPFFLLDDFYSMKKSAKVLHYFGLDCGMLEFFKYSAHEPCPKEKLLTLLHSWSPVWREDNGLCPYNPSAEEVGGLDRFLYNAAQNVEVFQNIHD
jgi:hypothetical protein